jgi:hypothetical protein
MPESLNDQIKDELLKEAQTRGDISQTLALAHYVTSALYGMFNFWVGMLNTVLAATASVSALSKIEGSGTLTAILSVLVAALTALLTFLSPSDRNKFHWDAGAEFEMLSCKFFRFVDVMSQSETPNQELEKRLDELMSKYFQVRKSYPIPAWSWQLAKKKIREPGNFARKLKLPE